MNSPAETNSKRERLKRAIEQIKIHRGLGQIARRARFEVARKRIHIRILEEFRQHEWPRFQMLDEIFKKDLGLPIPTLSVCGAGTAEVRFTKLLAHFFDSQNHHGLGALLARAVFAEEIDAPVAFDHCAAYAEVSLGMSQLSDGQQMHNSLDILIEAGDHKILVEQKIKSPEGKEQLVRYSAGMRKKFGDAAVHCFYLTPEGRQGHGDDWKPLSHRDLFCRMASLLERHALSPAARHNLRAFLWDLMLGPLAQDHQWMEELKHQAHRVARDYRHYTDLKKWFERYGMSRDEMRMLAKIVGD
jgi:hypothetical protein